MYINKISFLIICVSSLLFSATTYTDNELLLTLDPFDLSNFVLNKYHPNQNIDLTYYSIILDGSSNFPLYQSIPSEISFDRNKAGTISELKYKERKADKYFDTGIALKKDINNQTNLLLQVESKSIVENINQNAFFDYKKTTDNLILELSYLYHYEDDPDFYSLVKDNDSNKENESFNYGLNVNYSKNKLSFNNHFAFQTSYVNRPFVNQSIDNIRIEYDHRAIWCNSSIDYHLSKTLKLYYNNIYKKNLVEYYNTQSYLIINEYFNQASIGFSYAMQNLFLFSIGIDQFISDKLGSVNKPHIQLSYNRENIRVEFSIDNFVIDQMDSTTDGNWGDIYEISYTSKYATSVIFDYRVIENSFEFGEIDNYNYNYNYFITHGLVNAWKLVFNYNYYNYFNQSGYRSLSIDSYFNYGISFYPFKDKYKFEMYGSVNYFQYEFNSSVDLLNFNLFDNYNNINNNVKLYNFSIGFIFDSFTISYNFKNGLTNQTLNNYILFADNMYNFGHFNYIEIDWIFKE